MRVCMHTVNKHLSLLLFADSSTGQTNNQIYRSDSVCICKILMQDICLHMQDSYARYLFAYARFLCKISVCICKILMQDICLHMQDSYARYLFAYARFLCKISVCICKIYGNSAWDEGF